MSSVFFFFVVCCCLFFLLLTLLSQLLPVYVLGIAIDFQNRQGTIGYVGYNALYVLSLIFYVVSYTTLIVSWCRVVRTSLPTKFYSRVVDVVQVTGIVNFVSVVLFLSTSLSHLQNLNSKSSLKLNTTTKLSFLNTSNRCGPQQCDQRLHGCPCHHRLHHLVFLHSPRGQDSLVTFSHERPPQYCPRENHLDLLLLPAFHASLRFRLDCLPHHWGRLDFVRV